MSMKKTEILSLGILSAIILATIALMDYLFTGLDSDSRRRNIEIILIFSTMILFLVLPKFVSDQDEVKQFPFYIDLLSLGIAYLIHSLIESSIGGLTTHPFFTEEGVFDSRSPISFLIYILLFYGTDVILKKVYFFLENRREEKIKSRRNLQ